MGLFDKPKPEADISGLAQKVETLTSTVQSLQGNISEITSAVKTLHSNQQQLTESMGGLKQGLEDTGRNHQFQDVANEERIRSLAISDDRPQLAFFQLVGQ